MQSRLVVQGNVYFQPKEGRIDCIPPQAWERLVVGEEQPFVRHFQVGGEWVPLDSGWLKEGCYLVLVNRLPVYEVNPTLEQRKADLEKVIQIGFDCNPETSVAVWLIYPGEHHQGTPADLSLVRLRCRKGKANISLYLYPN